MNYHDAELASRSYKLAPAPLNIYCSLSTCNVILPAGTPAKVYDGATVTHVICPTFETRNFAAHKQPDTGMKLRA